MHLQPGVFMLNIELFSGIEESNMLSLLQCLGIETKKYKKNSIIIPFETKLTSIGIVLEGNVDVIKEDINGNRIIVAKLATNDIFGEAIVCAGIEKSPVTIVANSSCEILFLPFNKILTTCQKACPFHRQLVQNMLMIIAKKNIVLNSQIDLLGKKTTREKLLTYLRIAMKNSGSNIFSIPYNRNELADFLCVDRSAMSRELCKLRDDGIIKFNKNEFMIIKDELV